MSPPDALARSASAAPLLDELNPQQRLAALHALDGPGGPLLIIAGAGSGKTKTLAHRVAQLILAGADPARILLLTFSRRASIEMTRRAQGLVSRAAKSARRLSWAGTFHAIANRLLRLHAHEVSTRALLDVGGADSDHGHRGKGAAEPHRS